jgi:hypothetical protein
MKNLLLSVLVLAAAACTYRKSPLDNQVVEGHQELYSLPQAPKLKADEPITKRVVIMSTNDLQGQYRPQEIRFSDRHNKEAQSVMIGGVDVISSYFTIAREHFRDVVLVDSGNILPADSGEHKAVQNFYGHLKYDGFTLGLGDFNLRLPASHAGSSDFFQDFAKKTTPPLLVSNLYELKTARVVEWQGARPYVMKEINGVKVGIIGLIPDDIVKLTPTQNRVGLYVENMLQSTLRNARLLRSLGADLIVVITHQGVSCGREIANKKRIPLEKVNFDPLAEGVCEKEGVLGEYLQRLPPQLVDLVVGGRHQEKMANFINDIPVVSGFGATSFNMVEFHFDPASKALLREKTLIHQPVMFCREFFKETNDCYYQDPSVDHRIRTPATFLGRPVEPDPHMHKIFPEHKQPKTADLPSIKVEIQEALQAMASDISFYDDSTSGNSQLLLIKLTGRELSHLLEQDFNQGDFASWLPSPYLAHKNGLTLRLGGKQLDLQGEYQILTDLEGIQRKPSLRKFINSGQLTTLINHSWNSLSVEIDSISTGLAAQRH